MIDSKSSARFSRLVGFSDASLYAKVEYFGSDDGAGVHTGLDDLDRHAAFDRHGLLRHVDEAEAALADLLEDLVGADHRADLFADDRRAGGELRGGGGVRIGRCRIIRADRFVHAAGFLGGVFDGVDHRADLLRGRRIALFKLAQDRFACRALERHRSGEMIGNRVLHAGAGV